MLSASWSPPLCCGMPVDELGAAGASEALWPSCVLPSALSRAEEAGGGDADAAGAGLLLYPPPQPAAAIASAASSAAAVATSGDLRICCLLGRHLVSFPRPCVLAMGLGGVIRSLTIQ